MFSIPISETNKVSMIYINGRFLTQRLTGVNRYAYELCKALTLININFTLIVPKASILNDYNIECFHIVKYGIGNSHVWEQLFLPFFFVGKKNYILLNFTSIGPILIQKKIITIHDLAYLENPKWYSKTYYLFYKLLTPLAIKTSMRIFTVSRFSKKEIARLLNFDINRIDIIYNAVNHVSSFNKLFTRLLVDIRYILIVSSLDTRKNFARLIKAMDYVIDDNIKLYIVGSYNSVFAKDNLKFKDNVVFLGHVSDNELYLLYSNALLFVYPSLYEGFGLPPLEAMALGCPCIVSDIPVFKEIDESAVLYADPYNAADIAEKINTLLTNNELRKSFIDLGYEQAKKYNWERSARKIVDIIAKLQG